MPSKKRTSRKRAMDKEVREKQQAHKKTSNKKKPIWLFAIILIVVIVAVGAAAVYLTTTGSDDNQTDEDTYDTENPVAVIDTSMGVMKLELYEDLLPNTVDNFIKLANDGFYDGLIFHRVKDDFMIQAGRSYPDDTQKQSPYGSIDLEIHPDVTHVDGAISMGQIPGDPNSATSEFFICDGAQRGLDDDFLQENYGQSGYAAFGVVFEGFDVLRDIASTPHDESLEPTPENPHLPGGGRPLTDVIINSITIENV